MNRFLTNCTQQKLQFSTSLLCSTIRAFEAGPALFYRLCDNINKQQHATNLMNSGRNWLAIRLEFVGTSLATLGCFAFVVTKYLNPEVDASFAETASVALTYLLGVNSQLNYLVQYASDFEADMVAVERIEEYIQLEKEAPHQMPADNLLEKGWPSKGLIEFKNVNMRYRPGFPLVLKDFNVMIPSKAKVGICGRTGECLDYRCSLFFFSLDKACVQFCLTCHSGSLSSLQELENPL